MVFPLAPRMGAPLSSMGISPPRRERSSVWFASPTTLPARRTLATGLSTTWRVSSETMQNTSSSGRPRASPSAHPVSVSATGFMKLTFPAVSVAITASPMLRSVLSSQRRASSSRSSRAARSSASAQCRQSVSTKVRSSVGNGRGS